MTTKRACKVRAKPEVERIAVNVYSMNRQIWQAFAGQAKSRGSNVGDMLEIVLRKWLREQSEIGTAVVQQEVGHAAS